MPIEYDAKKWRKILALAHPDSGGDEELFKYLKDLRDVHKDAEERGEVLGGQIYFEHPVVTVQWHRQAPPYRRQ